MKNLLQNPTTECEWWEIICGWSGSYNVLYDESADTIFDHGYCVYQIFNVDEISPNYEMLPNETLAATADRGSRSKVMQGTLDSSNVMCASVSGSSFRLPSLIIEKLAKSHALKKYNFR